jgi:phosphate starvation-inducible protein PhoH
MTRTFERFEIDLNKLSDAEKAFAMLLIEQKPSLRDSFEKSFDAKFDLENKFKDGKIAFTTTAGNENFVRKGYAALSLYFLETGNVTKELIEKTPASINLCIDLRSFAPDTAPQQPARKQFAKANAYGDRKKNYTQRPNDRSNGRGNYNQGSSQGGFQRPTTPTTPYKFQAKNEKQQSMFDMIDRNDVTFGIGPAGTGKTHLAVAKAVAALESGQVQKILLARPAISNGEKLGALPGDIRDKLAPYMRPLYDEMNTVLGNPEKLLGLMESGVIEIVPVEMMRGRTFKDSYVIVDEAQNATEEQTRMFLTRLGEGSKMVVTGDPKQIDLKPRELSGLQWALDKLAGIDGISSQYFGAEDVVRHPVVAAIVKALDGDTIAPNQAAKPVANDDKAPACENTPTKRRTGYRRG